MTKAKSLGSVLAHFPFLLQMRIHEEATEVSAGKTHYNMERETWDTKPLLEVLADFYHWIKCDFAKFEQPLVPRLKQLMRTEYEEKLCFIVSVFLFRLSVEMPHGGIFAWHTCLRISRSKAAFWDSPTSAHPGRTLSAEFVLQVRKQSPLVLQY